MFWKKHCILSNSRLLISNMAIVFSKFQPKISKSDIFSAKLKVFFPWDFGGVTFHSLLVTRWCLLDVHYLLQNHSLRISKFTRHWLQIHSLLVTCCKLTHCSLLVAEVTVAKYDSHLIMKLTGYKHYLFKVNKVSWRNF